MSVWLCLPSKRKPEESTLSAWREHGYKVAVAREWTDEDCYYANIVIPVYAYQGWPRSTNMIIQHVMAFDPDVNWFVAGGDDTLPDPNHTPEEIADQCLLQFCPLTGTELREYGTFGVMQPTGDPWKDEKGRIIERIAGSPWIGREFARRMYHGAGPLYPGFFHNFADEHLQCVAQKLGVFWQRPDLIQEHRHWARKQGSWDDAPEWGKRDSPMYHPDEWTKSKALFDRLKAGGFAEANQMLEE